MSQYEHLHGMKCALTLYQPKVLSKSFLAPWDLKYTIMLELSDSNLHTVLL